MRNFFWSFAPSIIWMTIIFTFSSRQRVSVSDELILNFLFFKTLHVIEYAVLFLLNYRAVRLSAAKTDPGKTAFFLTVLYAITDEWHQTLVPTREGALRDVIIDTFGAILIWFSIKNIYPNLPPKPKAWAGSFAGVFFRKIGKSL